MRILSLTAGTGSFYCGTCLRDAALVQGLRALGHDAVLAPLYLPLVLEEDVPSEPVHLGGINVYLAQALRLPLPRFLRAWLDSPGLLRWAARRGDMTQARALGELTVAMLAGEEGPQLRELGQLFGWLRTLERPDVVLLSNALLVGLARPLARELGAPVLCSLQGEAPYLDALVPPYRERAWRLMVGAAADVEHFLAVSRYTAELMRARLGLSAERVHVVPNGIDLAGLAPPARCADPPVIGYLARLCRDKGLETLVEAFIDLRRRPGFERLRLVAGGTALRRDLTLLRELEQQLSSAGLAGEAEFHPNLTREAKLALLRRCTLFSVPALYGESFGLYLLEAWALGLPVVQPEDAAFPELLAATGGGLLYTPGRPGALADALATLLADPQRARALGAAGRRAVEQRFTLEHMARDVERVCRMSRLRPALPAAHQ
jgi:glycosyltransferase involved in cell wall biosynthesis